MLLFTIKNKYGFVDDWVITILYLMLGYNGFSSNKNKDTSIIIDMQTCQICCHLKLRSSNQVPTNLGLAQKKWWGSTG